MNVFVDTNVFLDAFLNRDFTRSDIDVLSSVEFVQLYISIER